MARRNTAQWAERIRYHRGSFAGAARDAGRAGHSAGGWITGRPGSQPLSIDGTRTWLLTHGRRSLGYAHGSQPEAGPPTRSSISVPEKELADLIYQFGEERRSRRISRAIVRARPIHYDTAIVACDRRGRAPDEQVTSGHPDVHGIASGGERRARAIGQPARACAGNGQKRRAHCHSFLHVAGRPKSEAVLSGAGAGRESGDSYPARRQAVVRGNQD